MAFNTLVHYAQECGMGLSLRDYILPDSQYQCDIQCGSIHASATHASKGAAKDLVAQQVLRQLGFLNLKGGYFDSFRADEAAPAEHDVHALQPAGMHHNFDSNIPSFEVSYTGEMHAKQKVDEAQFNYHSRSRSAQEYSKGTRLKAARPPKHPGILEKKPRPETSVPNPVGVLQELSRKLEPNLPATRPEYITVGHQTMPDLSHVFTVECKFLNVSQQASSYSIKYAKSAVADLMLKHIADTPTVLAAFKRAPGKTRKERPQNRRYSATKSNVEPKADNKVTKSADETVPKAVDCVDGATESSEYRRRSEGISFDGEKPVSSLQEIIQKMGWTLPRYSFEAVGSGENNDSGCSTSEGDGRVGADIAPPPPPPLKHSVDHTIMWKCVCTIPQFSDKSSSGVAGSKSEAKNVAAHKMYEVLMDGNKLEELWAARRQRIVADRKHNQAEETRRREASYLCNLVHAKNRTVRVLLEAANDAVTVDNPHAFLASFADENKVALRAVVVTEKENPRIDGYINVLSLNTKPNVLAAGLGATVAEAEADAAQQMFKILSKALKDENQRVKGQSGY